MKMSGHWFLPKPKGEPMKIYCIIVAAALLLLCFQPAFAKDAGDLLEQYLSNPRKAVHQEELALVEIVSVKQDAKPEGDWKRTGTLELKAIESTGKRLPQTFSVRFFKREEPGPDAWTWDGVRLEQGKRLLGFFNNWEGRWAVREDGRHNVINNPENIKPALLGNAQKLFKTRLIPDR
jgi:hypothetical protein